MLSLFLSREQKEKNKALKKGKKRYNFARDTTKYIDAIRQAGLKTHLYLSVQEDEVYCLLGITEKRLREEADRLDYDLSLDINKVSLTNPGNSQPPHTQTHTQVDLGTSEALDCGWVEPGLIHFNHLVLECFWFFHFHLSAIISFTCIVI